MDRSSAEREFEPQQEKWLPTRHSLLSRLKDSADDESWRLFFDTYWKLIYNVAIRAGLNDAEAQDVVQETVISVMKAIPTFEYDPTKGMFKTWLLQLTHRRISDRLRKIYKERSIIEASKGRRRNDDDTATAHRVPDSNNSGFEQIWNDEWENNAKEAALNRLKRRVELKHFQIFDLHVIKGWKAQKVAKALNVSCGFVYLTKHRVQRIFKQEIDRIQLKSL